MKKKKKNARPGNPVGDPACIWAEPKEALQGTSFCELISPRHKNGNGRAGRRRQERSARGAGGRERSAGTPGLGKRQGEEGRTWRSPGGRSAAIRATVGRGGRAGIEAHRGSKGTRGVAQRWTASRKGARELDFRGGRKTATFALEMEMGCFANENAGLCCQIWMSLTVDLAYGPH